MNEKLSDTQSQVAISNTVPSSGSNSTEIQAYTQICSTAAGTIRWLVFAIGICSCAVFLTLGTFYFGNLSFVTERREEVNKICWDWAKLLFKTSDFTDAKGLLHKLQTQADEPSKYVYSKLSKETQNQLQIEQSPKPSKTSEASQHISFQPSKELIENLRNDLNKLLQGPLLYEQEVFRKIASDETKKMIESVKMPPGETFTTLFNRRLLDDAYNAEIKKTTFINRNNTLEEFNKMAQAREQFKEKCAELNEQASRERLNELNKLSNEMRVITLPVINNKILITDFPIAVFFLGLFFWFWLRYALNFARSTLCSLFNNSRVASFQPSATRTIAAHFLLLWPGGSRRKINNITKYILLGFVIAIFLVIISDFLDYYTPLAKYQGPREEPGWGKYRYYVWGKIGIEILLLLLSVYLLQATRRLIRDIRNLLMLIEWTRSAFYPLIYQLFKSIGDPLLQGANETSYDEDENGDFHLQVKFRFENGFWLFRVSDFADLASLCNRLKEGKDPLSDYLHNQLTLPTHQLLEQCLSSEQPDKQLEEALINDLNKLLKGDSIYKKDRFKEVTLSNEIEKMIEQNPQGEALIHLNRTLLETAYPREIKRHSEDFDGHQLIIFSAPINLGRQAQKFNKRIKEAKKEKQWMLTDEERKGIFTTTFEERRMRRFFFEALVNKEIEKSLTEAFYGEVVLARNLSERIEELKTSG